MSIDTFPPFSSKIRRPPTGLSNMLPRRLSATAVPMFGCPANGSSAVGVKMRTHAVCFGSSGGRTNVVSERLNSRAIRCIAASESPSAPYTTASGLPPHGATRRLSAAPRREARFARAFERQCRSVRKRGSSGPERARGAAGEKWPAAVGVGRASRL
eukprot:scaffold303381_cov30-Tisochrysis_lutea.AAC.1